MNEVRKHSGCLWVSQRARCVLWLVPCQQPVVQECIITPDTELAEILKVYATDDRKLFACNHRVFIVPVLSVEHLFVRLHIPIVIIFVFNRGLVEDFRWADVVVTSKPSEM